MSTPYLLQDALVAELEAFFAGFETLNAGGEPAPMNIYPQTLPAKMEEDDSEHFPYIIVRVVDGGSQSEGEPDTCRAILLVGVYDEQHDRQGNKIVLNVLQRIRTHLLSKRIVNKQFRIDYPCEWSVYDDEDLHPYYFGAVETNWTLPAIQQEVDF